MLYAPIDENLVRSIWFHCFNIVDLIFQRRIILNQTPKKFVSLIIFLIFYFSPLSRFIFSSPISTALSIFTGNNKVLIVLFKEKKIGPCLLFLQSASTAQFYPHIRVL